MQLPPPNRLPERCYDCQRQFSTLLIAVAAAMLIGVAIGRASMQLRLTGWEQW